MSAAGELAREALRSLAAQPGGDEMVARALDTWFDNQADFGILSGAAAIALVWMVCASDIEFTIGRFRFHKVGLSGAQQKALANSLIPGVVRRLAGK